MKGSGSARTCLSSFSVGLDRKPCSPKVMSSATAAKRRNALLLISFGCILYVTILKRTRSERYLVDMENLLFGSSLVGKRGTGKKWDACHSLLLLFDVHWRVDDASKFSAL